MVCLPFATRNQFLDDDELVSHAFQHMSTEEVQETWFNCNIHSVLISQADCLTRRDLPACQSKQWMEQTSNGFIAFIELVEQFANKIQISRRKVITFLWFTTLLDTPRHKIRCRRWRMEMGHAKHEPHHNNTTTTSIAKNPHTQREFHNEN